VYGQALYETGEFDEARKVFERALTLDPENLIALRSLGDMSLQSGNTAEAHRWYTRLLDADPKDTAVIATRNGDRMPRPRRRRFPLRRRFRESMRMPAIRRFRSSQIRRAQHDWRGERILRGGGIRAVP